MTAPGSSARTRPATGCCGSPRCCPSQLPHHLWAILLLSPPDDLHGLTPFDLTVLGLLLDNWPELRIAAWLQVAEGTITGRIPHITAMLHAPDRALALGRAARLGLYIPRSLIRWRG